MPVRQRTRTLRRGEKGEGKTSWRIMVAKSVGGRPHPKLFPREADARAWIEANPAAVIDEGPVEVKTSWQAEYRDVNGARRFKDFARKKDAEGFLLKVEHEVSHGLHVPDSQSLTVAEVAQIWLKRGQREKLESSTLRSYETTVRLHIVPLIGGAKVSRLTMPMVEDFKDRLIDSRSRDTAARAIRYLSMILQEAQRKGYVAQNVAKGVKVITSSRDATEVVIPTPDELKAMLKHSGPELRPLVMTAMLAALRASELRGLMWKDVDLKKGTVTVVQRADEKNKLGSPKSKAGRRTIPLSPKLWAELREWKLRCQPTLLDLVFPSPEGQIWSYHNLMNRAFWPMQVAAKVTEPKLDPVDGLPMWDEDGKEIVEAKYGLHALRHAAASLWIKQGIDLKRLKTWMGHASVQTTIDRYGHLMFDEVADADLIARAEQALFA